MTKKNFFAKWVGSLKLALLFTIIAGIGVAVAVFFGVRNGFNYYINNRYLARENKLAREETYINDLQSYVDRNNIADADTSFFAKWAREHKYVYLMIYKDDEIWFTSEEIENEPENDKNDGEAGEENDQTPPDDSEEGGSDGNEGDGESEEEEERPTTPGSGISGKYPTYEELKAYAEQNDAHIITLKEGHVMAYIAEFTEYLYYDISNIVSLIAAAVAFSILIAVFFGRILIRIRRLASDVNQVAAGDMSYKIRSQGSDEISRLSLNVENMRSSILENLEREREARNANEELITSMSHDIRTPLTVLLGYLDVMKFHTTDETMSEYLRASETTAMRLKKLSDDMFNYFLVFGNQDDSVELCEYDAETLLPQLLEEHILLLRENGYSVKLDDLNCVFGMTVTTDAPKIMRIIDNVFSNLYKYSEISEPIFIGVKANSGGVELIFENIKKKNSADAESTGIGLKTCRKIATLLKLEFESGLEADIYKTVIKIPAKRNDIEAKI